MILFFALLSCLGEAALIHAMLILLQLSKKLGEVTRMKPLYRGYYVSIVLLGVTLVIRILNVSFLFSPAANSQGLQQHYWTIFALPHHILLAAGLTIALPVTWKYWGWLMSE